MASTSHFLPLAAALAAVALVPAEATAQDAAAAERPVSVRIRWGGGTPQAWQGSMTLVRGPGPAEGGPALPCLWRTLSTEPDAAALARDVDGSIVVEHPRPIASDGVELTVADWRSARLRVRLGTAGGGGATFDTELPLTEILAGAVQRPLDDFGNRITIETAPGDSLRVTLVGRGPDGATAVRRPGEPLRLRVEPLLVIKPQAGEFELRLRLARARQEKVIDTRTAAVRPLESPATGASPDGFAAGRVPTPFASIDFDLTLPPQEGVYEVTLEAVERGGLRWMRPLATRTIQVVAIEPAAPPPTADRPWGLVYELDPGSPKLHERLRRLPTRGLPDVPLPTIPLPTMPLPSLSRPRMPLPRLPEVPLPDVSAMVPRFGGLLAAGHSVVVPHELGTMLRLPPAPRPTEPSWEGVVVPNAQPGLPHLVEIEYPSAQRAAVAVCVLEPDATGSAVEVRHAGGFEVSPAAGEALGRHRFAFWPTSRNPLVVLANPAATPALLARMRITAGPDRLPRIQRAATPAIPAVPGRPAFAMLDAPDLHRRYGGAVQVAATGGRPVADWVAQLDGIRHSAEAVSAGSLTGGVVKVYGEGAAAWPSLLTRQAPRWDPAAAGDAGLDPTPKDLLAAIEAVYGREDLKLVPAFSFDAAIPALEDLLGGETAAGIACVGADGRPRRLPGGIHYNILDPRVQQAVEAIVLEAASRLAGSSAAAGVALLLPHDGWLHLPGIAWGLDDATFDRFLAAIGDDRDLGADGRFAERARLVSGPLREPWLAWRAEVVAAFHARLSASVAGIDARWPVYVVPTSLFAQGPLAARFRPGLTDPDTADLFREIGLVTTLAETAPGEGRLVFMAPHVEPTSGTLDERSTIAAANAGLPMPRGGAAGGRGVAVASRPLVIDLSAVVPHGPFGSASPPAPVPVALVSAGGGGDRGLAEPLVAADVEAVFDARTAVVLPESMPEARGAFESLPALPMQLATASTAPLIIRTATAAGVMRVAVVNAGPAAVRAELEFGGQPSAVLDAAGGPPLPLGPGNVVTVTLPAWGMRSLVVDGGAELTAARNTYDEAVRADVARRIERLRRGLAMLEAPAPLDVLDNPGFELGLDAAALPGTQPTVTGWELVEARRGSLRLVTGLPARDGPEPASVGRGLEFSSRNGLSTLRSNPFAPPATGRISVAAWLRVKPGEPQPPLRIAIEGVEDGREYYRFAAIGGLAGGRPLTAEWSLFVLEIADLPAVGIESLRVRFDLLGPGAVEIDDVRAFDLAFDEADRGLLAKQVARIEHRLRLGDVGGALAALDDHWPTFLEAFANDEAVASMSRQGSPQADRSAPTPAGARQGTRERFRGWRR